MYSRILPLFSMCMCTALATPVGPVNTPFDGDPSLLTLEAGPTFYPVRPGLDILIHTAIPARSEPAAHGDIIALLDWATADLVKAKREDIIPAHEDAERDPSFHAISRGWTLDLGVSQPNNNVNWGMAKDSVDAFKKWTEEQTPKYGGFADFQLWFRTGSQAEPTSALFRLRRTTRTESEIFRAEA